MRILSLDGGGVYGISSARILEEIEKKTGKRISDIFDLMVGTSIGAVQVALLNKPSPKERKPFYTAENVKKLIKDTSQKIFSAGSWQRVISLNGWSRALYSDDQKEALFDEILGNYKMRDGLKHMILTSYDAQEEKPYLINNFNVSQENWRVSKILNVATNIPGVFKPTAFIEGDIKKYLIDGGFVFMDPTLLALIKADELYPDADKILISIGSGHTTINENIQESDLETYKDMMDILDNALSFGNPNCIDEFMNVFLSRGTFKLKKYYRLDPVYPKDIGSFSDASDANVAKITSSAEGFIENNKETFQRISADLKSTH